MTAEEFLASLERRGYKVRAHRKGGIAIVSTTGLTDDDRAALKLEAAALERLLREREALAGLSRADALVLNEARKTFPGSRLVGIRPDPRHPLTSEEHDPVAEPIDRSNPVQLEADQLPLFAGAPPSIQRESSEQSVGPGPGFLPNARICSKCGHRCYDPERIHCKDCGADLESPSLSALNARSLDELAQPSNEDEAIPSVADISTDKPTPLSPEVIANCASEPEPEAPVADSADDPEQRCHEVSINAPSVKNIRSTAPIYDIKGRALDRSKRTLIWVTIERFRTTRGSGIRLTVCPSPSTNTDGARPVRFTVEGNDPSAVDQFKPGRLLVGPARLKRGGFRLVREGPGLRLAIEF
jgi:hypothetical protein